MQTNLLWTGIEYHSLENCVITSSEKGNYIKSTVIGYYQNKIYTVEYIIETNKKWETFSLELNYSINNSKNKIWLKKENNNWILNGTSTNEFKDCIDIDISITPFTNSLPINRIKLLKNQQQQIKVIYFNVLENQVKAVEQNYKCVSRTTYLYQNIPNDFEAEIEVDSYSFVVNYPGLFKRTASIQFDGDKQLSNIIIREATKNDIPIIRDLVYKIWPNTYGKILSPQQIEYMLNLMYSDSSLSEQFNAHHTCLIVEEDTQPIAFASYNQVKDEIYKLQKIYTLPEQQGKGIGKMLIHYIIKEIKKENATALLLNVNRNNKAKQFYEHLGFKVISEEDIDIGEGYFMNDYVMSYEL